MEGPKGTLRHGLLRKTRHPLEMVILLALLIAVGLPLVKTASDDRISCHVCESESNLNCSNPVACDNDKRFCLLAVTRIFERFFYVSKQCTRVCPTPPLYYAETPSEPKGFVLEKPMPFLFIRCCKWDFCNDKAPISITMLKQEPGKASERRHRYTELLLPGFMVLTANGLSALSLL
ncbi:lymphocyte antigen 6K [Rattus rattus]|uniref:lymphocyte antigen 6K n=1 Tax=Rattus rattus TaxID=10117 RepID=UPI0013F355F7|nr:lymphocyte antigen 6K [Rattus rattus]